ncbi:MAG TPA: AccI family restriction endonuclease [Pyrinomonadaceae bacterium]|nr:AccI family restriction endonuclease [Pyrinomonadaceae bacterium]
MNYKTEIDELAQSIPRDIADFNLPLKKKNPPTQASSEFVTNREQGDWAERLVIRAINKTSDKFVAVQYGKADRLIAGEPGFNDFYNKYQQELLEIGKRPDVLIFRTEDYDFDWSFNISEFPPEMLNKIVPKALAGLEIRSSSFLIEEYDEDLRRRLVEQRSETSKVLEEILRYSDLLADEARVALEDLNPLTFENYPSRIRLDRSERSKEVRALLKRLGSLKKQLTQTRDFLSFTPKVEDLKVVLKWIQVYGVPHYYFQVFFDKVYGISFSQILQLTANPLNRNKRFYVERDTKNQLKSTIKVNVREGDEVAYKVTMPVHRSELKKLPRGRLLFHVAFEGGEAYLNLGTLYGLLQLEQRGK